MWAAMLAVLLSSLVTWPARAASLNGASESASAGADLVSAPSPGQLATAGQQGPAWDQDGLIALQEQVAVLENSPPADKDDQTPLHPAPGPEPMLVAAPGAAPGGEADAILAVEPALEAPVPEPAPGSLARAAPAAGGADSAPGPEAALEDERKRAIEQEALEAEALLARYESSRTRAFRGVPAFAQEVVWPGYAANASSWISRGAPLTASLAAGLNGPDNEAIDPPLHKAEPDHVLGTIFAAIATLFFVLFTWMVIVEVREYISYRREAKECKNQDNTVRIDGFFSYNAYKMSSWFVAATHAELKVISVVFCFLVLVGSTIYFTLCGQRLTDALHKTVAWLVSPDTGIAETSRMGAAIGVAVSIIGLMFFALTLSMIQDAFNRFVENLKEGADPIIAVNHVVVVGLTEDTVALVQQLCYAYEFEGGTTIAVLAQQPTPEAQAILMEGLDTRNSEVIVRSGIPDKASSLAMVGAQFCKLAVLVPDRRLSKEKRDAYTLQTLCVLKARNWPLRGRILVMASLPRNMRSFQEVGGKKVDVLTLDHVVGSILVSCSEHPQLAPIVDDLCGFNGAEFYITDEIPENICGMKFIEAGQHYSDQVLVGVVHRDAPHQPRLCVEVDTVLEEGDKLIMLAEDAASLEPGERIEFEAHEWADKAHGDPEMRTVLKEIMLFIGWSQNAGLMILKLDSLVARGTVVYSFDESATQQREVQLQQSQRRNGIKLKNITVKFSQGDLGSRWQLKDLGNIHHFEWFDVDRVFIVTSRAGAESWKADALTMSIAVQVRDMIVDVKRRSSPFGDRRRPSGLPAVSPPPIVLELHNPHTESSVWDLGFRNYLVSSSIPSKVMATVSQQPLLKEVFLKIFSSTGNPITLRQLGDYLENDIDIPHHDEVQLSFFQAQSIVARSRDVLIGWTRYQPELEQEEGTSSMFQSASQTLGLMDDDDQDGEFNEAGAVWEINPPDKTATRPWVMSTDTLIVISHKANEDLVDFSDEGE